MMKSRVVGWAVNVACMRVRSTKFLSLNLKGRDHLGDVSVDGREPFLQTTFLKSEGNVKDACAKLK
jgi:hypothetical protein